MPFFSLICFKSAEDEARPIVAGGQFQLSVIVQSVTPCTAGTAGICCVRGRRNQALSLVSLGKYVACSNTKNDTNVIGCKYTYTAQQRPKTLKETMGILENIYSYHQDDSLLAVDIEEDSNEDTEEDEES